MSTELEHADAGFLAGRTTVEEYTDDLADIRSGSGSRTPSEVDSDTIDSKSLHIGMASLLAEASRAIAGKPRSGDNGSDLMDRIEDALNDATYGTFDYTGDARQGFHFEMDPAALDRLVAEADLRRRV